MDDYASYDALGLAELIRGGHVSRAEVAAAAYAAAQKAGDELNAFTEGPFPQALEFDAAGPFAGVPFVLKDILCHARGVPVHSGSRVPAGGVVYEHDTILMERFRRAGLATIGTTRTPEFGLSTSTEARLGGAVRNPWDRSRSAGGSSGGSAALVAAGVVPVAHASDGAGSIRIPAAHCGVVGLKPSRGRIPIGPDVAELFFGNAVEFVLTRTVRDTAAFLDVLHGNEAGEKYAAPDPSGRYRDIAEADGTSLRIAVASGAWTSSPVGEGIAAAMSNVAAVLADAGHHVEIVDPPLDWDALCEAATTIWCAGTAAAVVPLAESLNIRRLQDAPFERTTIACAEAGRLISAVELVAAQSVFNTISRSMANFMTEWDVLACPTSTQTAPPLGEFLADDDYAAEDWVRKCLDPYPAGVLYNITGAPAMTVPVAIAGDGMPVGVQLGAEIFREDLLIQVAGTLQRHCWSSDRRPTSDRGTTERGSLHEDIRP
ncbi:amidase [Mycolicibacterium sp. XJ1819]